MGLYPQPEGEGRASPVLVESELHSNLLARRFWTKLRTRPPYRPTKDVLRYARGRAGHWGDHVLSKPFAELRCVCAATSRPLTAGIRELAASCWVIAG